MSNIRINDFASRKQYTYAGGDRDFVVDFPFFQNTDLFVYVGDPDNNYDQQDPVNILTYGVDYTVTGAGLNTGGVVTIDDAVDLEVGWTVTIVGWMPVDRFAIYDTSSVISKAQLNEDFNRLTVMLKNQRTVIEQLIPKYDRSEIVNIERSLPDTPYSYVNFPLLRAGEIWTGNETSSGLTKALIGNIQAGFVSAAHAGMKKSIATWVGDNDFVLTDSQVDIDGALFIPSENAPAGPVGGFGDDFAAFQWPRHGVADRPASPEVGYVYYDDGLNGYYGYIGGQWRQFAIGDSFNNGGIVKEIIQDNDFDVGDIVRMDEGTMLYVRAQADTTTHAEKLGVVIAVAGGPPTQTSFTLQVIGYLEDVYSGKTPGRVYFLSPDLQGEITDTEPNVNGQVSLPVYIAETATTGWFLHFRGVVVGEGLPVNESPGVIIITVEQEDHGFEIGEVIYIDAEEHYALAKADALDTAQAIGFVIDVIDEDHFKLQQIGYFNAFPVPLGLDPATVYFLSADNAGELTDVEPTVGNYSKKMLITDTATSGWIQEQREQLVQSGGGGGGEVLIYEIDITGETEIEINDIFTDDYDEFCIIGNNITWDTSAVSPFVRFEIASAFPESGYVRNPKIADSAFFAVPGGAGQQALGITGGNMIGGVVTGGQTGYLPAAYSPLWFEMCCIRPWAEYFKMWSITAQFQPGVPPQRSGIKRLDYDAAWVTSAAPITGIKLFTQDLSGEFTSGTISIFAKKYTT